MKVLFLTNQFSPPRNTGSGRSSYLIYEGLKEKGHDVDLCVLDSGEYEDDYVDAGYGDAFVPRSLKNMVSVVKDIEDGEYDVVHKYGAGIEKIFLGLRNFRRTRKVTTLNGIAHACWNFQHYDKNDEWCCSCKKNLKCIYGEGGPTEKRPPINFMAYLGLPLFLARKAVKDFDRFIAVSKAMKTMYEKAGFDGDKIEVVYNSFDPELKEHVESFSDPDTDYLTILYVGRVDEEKGVDLLLEAFDQLDYRDVELVIVGDGDQREELEEKYSDAEFTGLLDYNSVEMAFLYRKTDIFVHPGVWPEPSGRAVNEAGISKCAIVCSDIGGPAEMVAGNGLVFKKGSVSSLKEKLSMLIENGSLLESCKENCFERFARDTPKKTVEEIEEIYEEVVEERYVKRIKKSLRRLGDQG